MIDLTAMLLFERVVVEGSFTAAARALDMPKSTLSRKVSQLESRLGVRLLHRTTRSLSLTEVGAAYYERCARVVAEAEAADRAVAQHHDAPRGTLRLSAPPLLAEAFLAPVITDYTQRHAEVSVELMLTDRVVDLIEEGYDVAIRVGPPADTSFIARRLGPTQSYYCASPAYLEARGEPMHPDELLMHACILYSTTRGSTHWTFAGADGPARHPVEGRVQVNSFRIARQAALDGQGIAQLPSFVCADDLRCGRLVPVLRAWTTSTGLVQAIYPSKRQLSLKVRAFLDLLVEHFTPPPWVIDDL